MPICKAFSRWLQVQPAQSAYADVCASRWHGAWVCVCCIDPNDLLQVRRDLTPKLREALVRRYPPLFTLDFVLLEPAYPCYFCHFIHFLCACTMLMSHDAYNFLHAPSDSFNFQTSSLSYQVIRTSRLKRLTIIKNIHDVKRYQLEVAFQDEMTDGIRHKHTLHGKSGAGYEHINLSDAELKYPTHTAIFSCMSKKDKYEDRRIGRGQ